MGAAADAARERLRGAVASAAASVRAWRPRPPSTWEGWAYVALLAAALATRLYDLGGRALHYDEILHAWYSWRFAEGLGYAHTPLTHGPFLFHAAAFTYQVAGASDAASRLLPALFGVALVGLPYFLRRELGTYGALALAWFLLVSPSMLYFGRFIRNDIYMAVFALAMVAVVFRYRERPRTWLLFAWAVLWAFAFASKESAYLLAGTFGLFLLVMAGPALWEWARNLRRLDRVGPAGDLFLVLATLSLPLWAPLSGLLQGLFGVTLTNPDANDPRVQSGELVRAAVETGAPAGGAMYVAAILVLACAAAAVRFGLLWDSRRWPWLAASFAAVWLTLFTSVFTNWQGFFTGLWGSLGYWMGQQGVERASQPLHYYALGLATYEFAVAVPGVLGAAYLLLRPRSAFDLFIAAWAVLTFGLFTFAGERMPWLLVGITLPLAVVAARVTGMLVEEALKSPLRAAIAAVGGAVILGGGGYAALAFLVYEGEGVPGPLAFTTATLLAVALLAAALGVAYALRERFPTGPAPMGTTAAAVALAALTLASAATVVAAGRAAYSYAGYERPQELLVYSQTGQEASYGAECLRRVAEESGAGTAGLRVLIDESDNFAWQWRWYLRDYGAVSHQALHDTPLAEGDGAKYDVVAMSQSVEGANAGELGAFTRAGEMRHLWWFPNYAYNQLTPRDVLAGAASRDGWRTAFDYFLARDFGSSMQFSRGVIYVRNELAPSAADCTALRATPPGEA